MRLGWRRGLRRVGLVVGCVVLVVLAVGRPVQGAGHDGDEMAGHMKMTELRPVQPGDKERAAAIVVAARAFADGYTDYRKALADGYTIFHPEIKQHVYHFTKDAAAVETTVRFDAGRPTSLLYERVPAAKAGGEPGYKLVGVMYTAPFRASEEELNRRVPMSIARWHLHTNLCLPPTGGRADILGSGGKFGLQGSIVTAAACEQAGGQFLPHIFGWMVHVYPYETDPKKVWAAGMDDEHGMQHDAMPAGMDMPM